jgi:hypothetical protein
MASKEQGSVALGRDNNTKFFHHYENFRKNLNTIWDIKVEDRTSVSSFKEKVEAGVRHFQNIFSSQAGFPIQEILEVVGKFPSVFTKEMNQSLREEVTEVELLVSLSSMKNGKSLGPDRFPS